MDKVRKEIPECLCNTKIRELVDNNGNWRWEIFSELLPFSILVKIVIVYPPQKAAPLDFVIWDSSSNGKFSMKSTYANL